MIPYLSPELIRELTRTVVGERLDPAELLAQLPNGFRLQLRRLPDPGSVFQDLNTLNRTGRLDDQSLPLQVYLETGHFMLEMTDRGKGPGAAVFQKALAELSTVLSAPGGSPTFQWNAPVLARELITAGASSLLGVAWLERGLERAGAVARLSVATNDGPAHGTGFLVAPSILLTNHHVAFPDAAAGPRAVTVWFRFQEPSPGGQPPTVDVHDATARPDEADPADDWALVRLKSPVGYPHVQLRAPTRPLVVNDRVCIIQHPEGGPKKLSVHKNQVRSIDAAAGRVQYLTDTLPGSSGSPVFDDQWELVALHHAGTSANGVGGVLEHRNQGIAIARVLQGLAARVDAATRAALNL